MKSPERECQHLGLAGAFEGVTAETPDLEKYMAGLEKSGAGKV